MQVIVDRLAKRSQDRRGRDVIALEDVSFSAASEEFLAILGPSGCGKSTLLGLVAGLLPASAGEIFFEGERRAGQPLTATVFQEFALFPWRTAQANVEMGLEELGLPCWVKTSGSKGFHVVVPLDGKAGFDDVSGFAHAAGRVLVARDPEHLTQEFSKADRGGRILVDTARNRYGATVAAAYAVRARPGAPVSAPCTWEEIASGAAGPKTFTLRAMADRVAAVGDLWAGLRRRGRSLTRPAQRLRRLS